MHALKLSMLEELYTTGVAGGSTTVHALCRAFRICLLCSLALLNSAAANRQLLQNTTSEGTTATRGSILDRLARDKQLYHLLQLKHLVTIALPSAAMDALLTLAFAYLPCSIEPLQQTALQLQMHSPNSPT